MLKPTKRFRRNLRRRKGKRKKGSRPGPPESERKRAAKLAGQEKGKRKKKIG